MLFELVADLIFKCVQFGSSIGAVGCVPPVSRPVPRFPYGPGPCNECKVSFTGGWTAVINTSI